MKIRYFGFLAANAKITLDQVHLSIHLASGFELKPPMTTLKITPIPACRDCGATLQFICVTRPWISYNLHHTGPPNVAALG